MAAAERAKENDAETPGRPTARDPRTGGVCGGAHLAQPRATVGAKALGLYRGRWQIELVFKTLKGLLGIGDLAKYDSDSARAWMQAKLLSALLIQRLEREARFFPWGFPLLGALGLARISGDARQPLAGDCAGAVAATTAEGAAADCARASGTRTEEGAADVAINGVN